MPSRVTGSPKEFLIKATNSYSILNAHECAQTHTDMLLIVTTIRTLVHYFKTISLNFVLSGAFKVYKDEVCSVRILEFLCAELNFFLKLYQYIHASVEMRNYDQHQKKDTMGCLCFGR